MAEKLQEEEEEEEKRRRKKTKQVSCSLQRL
jgi:hypothetical protein